MAVLLKVDWGMKGWKQRGYYSILGEKKVNAWNKSVVSDSEKETSPQRKNGKIRRNGLQPGCGSECLVKETPRFLVWIKKTGTKICSVSISVEESG